MDQIPITKKGFAALEIELHNLKTVERPAIIEAISEARGHGDLKENAEYHAAKERQSFIEGRIKELDAAQSLANVIDPSTMSGDTIKFGATVTIVDDDDKEMTIQIVGPYESNSDEGKISVTAPMARGLIGKTIGDTVEISTPKGRKNYEVLKVVYK